MVTNLCHVISLLCGASEKNMIIWQRGQFVIKVSFAPLRYWCRKWSKRHKPELRQLITLSYFELKVWKKWWLCLFFLLFSGAPQSKNTTWHKSVTITDKSFTEPAFLGPLKIDSDVNLCLLLKKKYKLVKYFII
jgi:hypothetical protein